MDQLRSKVGASDVSAALRKEILGDSLSFDDRLPAERVLSDRFGVARGTVRDALKRLERQGFVETRPGSGTYVCYRRSEVKDSVIESARPLELIDSRFAIEPHICRLAVLHATSADLNEAEALLRTMERSGRDDPELFAKIDMDFHSLLAESTNNSLLVWMVTQMNQVRSQPQWGHMRSITLEENVIALYNKQHREIIGAIRAREPERSANAMKRHLETARLSLTRASAT